MRTFSKALSVSAVALLTAGCQLTPPPTALQSADVPAGFTAPVADRNAPIWPAADWWSNFNAPELPQLMATAMRENLDMKVAAGRVLEAEASTVVAGARLLPSVSGSLGATKRGTDTTNSDSFSAGLSGSYALDIFGQNRARVIASQELLRSARYSQTVIGLTIARQVASTYFSILSLRERITITRQNLDLSRQLLAVSQAKFAAGVTSNLDVMQETAQVAGQQSRLPALIEAERAARDTLAVLLGRPPEGIEIRGQSLDDLAAPTIRPGTPSELLLRRPDIAQAEASLYAAHANVDAARAAFFPQIGITAGVSLGSAVFGTLFDPASLAWSIGASLAQTIFDGGAINAQSQSARAVQEEQIATYRKVVFTGFQAVEAAVGNADSINQQLGFIVEQERASSESQRISNLQYREGTIDITTLLSVQQQLFSAQDTLVQTKLARLTASLNLWFEMGGGWNQKQSDADYKPQLDWFPL